MEGVWKVYYDEKKLNENYTCSGIRLDHYNEKPEDHKHEEENNFLKNTELNILRFKTSHGMQEKFREYMSQHDHLAAQEPYVTIFNKQLNFRNKQDPSIGYIEPERMGFDDFSFDENDEYALHDVGAFESQYLRYAQVLDTDYDNFAIVYSCQEGANYYDKSDEEGHPLYSFHDIWEHSKRKANPDPETSHVLTAYEISDKLKVEPIHKERIQILWRVPSFGDELYENKNAIERDAEPTPDALQTYLQTVSRLVPNMNAAYLEKHFGVMNHAGNSRTHDEETTSVVDGEARDEN